MGVLTMRFTNCYDMGYQTAYAKTSWRLSGETFNAYEEAFKEAYGYKLLDDDARRFIKGFVDYCATHSGTWTAIF